LQYGSREQLQHCKQRHRSNLRQQQRVEQQQQLPQQQQRGLIA
jgi:hypothetical protein